MTQPILVIVTNHDKLAGEPNGTYLPELTHAVHAFEERGLAYELASPKGGALPHYGGEDDELTQKMLKDDAFTKRIKTTTPLADVEAANYDAVFFPGGYGLLFDLVENDRSQKLTASFFDSGKPVAAVCHGPAALSQVTLSNGDKLIADKNVTGFTREEEVTMDTLEKVPFLLEEAMLEQGATYQKKKAMEVFVIEDGLLITGQNPPSAKAVGEALAARLT